MALPVESDLKEIDCLFNHESFHGFTSLHFIEFHSHFIPIDTYPPQCSLSWVAPLNPSIGSFTAV
jgi:hypothetical protein